MTYTWCRNLLPDNKHSQKSESCVTGNFDRWLRVTPCGVLHMKKHNFVSRNGHPFDIFFWQINYISVQHIRWCRLCCEVHCLLEAYEKASHQSYNWVPSCFRNDDEGLQIVEDSRAPMIYLLTAIGLAPGGSSTVHIYTQTIHRTTQNKQYIEQHKNYI